MTDAVDVPAISTTAPNGMLNGAIVVITSSSKHSVTRTRCQVLQFVSVPAPHLLVLTERQRLRIIFCSAIEYIDTAD